MKIISLILIFLCTGNIYSQMIHEKIVLAPKLNLRKAPSKSSEVLTTLPFNAKVELLEIVDTCLVEISKNTSSRWAKVKYNNCIGYVAQYYLHNKVEITQFATNPILINYKNWYKIVTTSKGDYLKKVAVKIDTINHADTDGGIRYFIVERDKNVTKDKLIKLIGTNELLKEKPISNYYSYLSEERLENKNSIGYEILKIELSNPKIRESKITFDRDRRFSNYYFEIVKDSLFLSNGQITQTLFQLRPNGICNVEWYGDLDGDNKLDLLIYTFRHRYLFLSKSSNHVQLLYLVFEEDTNEGC